MSTGANVNMNVNFNVDDTCMKQTQTQPQSKMNYLRPDPEVPGQQWCVLAFVSPEDLIEKKNMFFMDKFLVDEMNQYLTATSVHMTRNINAKLFKSFEEKIEKLGKSKSAHHKQLMEELGAIRKEFEVDEAAFSAECLHSHKSGLEDIKAKFEDYKVQRTDLEKEFDAANQQRTSVRGVKFCGAYPFQEAAMERAQFLTENVERAVDHYVCQSFHWAPFDPNVNAIQDQRYMNQELNELVRRRNENELMKQKFFEENKRQQMEKAQADTEALKRRLQDKYGAMKNNRS